MTAAAEGLEAIATKYLWSVTTLIKMALGISDSLNNWAVRYTAEFAIDNADLLRAHVEKRGRDETIDYLIRRRFEHRNKAADRGSEVHRYAKAIALGQDPGPIEDFLVPFVEQLTGWITTWEPEYLLAEAPVYNPEQGYAGTLDGIMRLLNKRLLFDIKTTDKKPDARSRPPYPEVALQLTAYRRATHLGILAEQRYEGRGNRYYVYDPTVEHEPMPEVDAAICIVVSPYDCFARAIRTNDQVWRAWQHMQQMAAWKDGLSKDVLGPELTRGGK